MFMRSVVAEDERVGLLLFDEPSASLDPTAEHGTKSGYKLSRAEC
jgi:ABC-type transport system involved in cytochrome bd biosynthesis fused ATPase/permease subunit